MAVSDIIVSNAAVRVAPIGTTLPATTLAVGAAWPAGWVSLGFTKEPVTVNYDADPLHIEINETPAPVDRRIKTEKLMIETVLAEFLGANLQYAYDTALSATAQVETITAGGRFTLTKRMVGFEGDYIDEDGANFPIRLILYRATAVFGAKLEFSAKKDYTGLPVKFEGLSDMGRAVGDRLFQLYKVIEP